MFKLIDKLKNDLEMVICVDVVKVYLKEDEVFNCYLGELWVDFCQWLKVDINSDDFRVKEWIVCVGQWFGEMLIVDDVLCVLLNGYLEQVVYWVVFEFFVFLMCYISDMVKSWDVQDMLL